MRVRRSILTCRSRPGRAGSVWNRRRANGPRARATAWATAAVGILSIGLAPPAFSMGETSRLFPIAGMRSPSAPFLPPGPFQAPATEVALGAVHDMVALPDGGFLAVVGASAEVVMRVGPRGDVSRFAGTGVGFSGDGGPATDAALAHVLDVALMPDGGVLISDGGNCRVRRVWPNGVITTVAGSDPPGSCRLLGDPNGDGGPATAARLVPGALAPTADGGFFVGDTVGVRRVAPDGTITTVAGNGSYGTPTVGGPALKSRFRGLIDLGATPDGSLLINSETAVYRVLPDNTLTLEATAGPNGALWLADDGSIYLHRFLRGRLFRLAGDGSLTLVAGGGRPGYFGGEGDPAIGSFLGVIEAETTPDGDLLLAACCQPFARVLLVARPQTPRLAVAVARESLAALGRRQLMFRLSRPASVEIELRRGGTRLPIPTALAHAGLNTETLPRSARGGPYSAYVRATAPDGAVASDELKVLVGGRLSVPVARRAISPLLYSTYDTPPPITRACRRFSPRRVDCVKADQDNEHPLKHARCTAIVSVVLRRSGYLYLRDYACPRRRRGPLFKRRPRWRAPARQSLPLELLYYR